MPLGLNVSMKQSHKILITPELRQSIEILQFSSMDLVNFINDQISENPMLNYIDSSFDQDGTRNTDRHKGNSVNQFKTSINTHSNVRENMYDPFDFIPSGNQTLETYLLEQISILNLNSYQLRIIKFLIGNLNESGFLDITPDKVASILSASREEVSEMTCILQGLDPIGIGSANLADYFLVQIERQKNSKLKGLSIKIVKNDLENLALKRFKQLSSKYMVDIKKIQEVSDFISNLNSRPIVDKGSSPTTYIIPDVSIEKRNEEYRIHINDKLLPPLTINKEYQKMVSQNKSDEVTNFLNKKYKSALDLIGSLEQRQITLYNVTKAIFEYQTDFFSQGISGLKPMSLKNISQMLNIHESTVSRVTSNKYVQTPRGVFELKFFFTNGVNKKGSNKADSVTHIKDKLKEIIDKEDKFKPLSDQKVKEQLNNQGFLISRRTVAKYREELGIFGSSKRRRY